MREEILECLERDSRLKAAELAVMVGQTEAAVAEQLAQMVDESIICGYNTLINWDKTDKEFVTALVEVRVSPQRGQGFDKIAERIYRFDEVKSVYLMSGGYDLTVIVEGRTIKDIATFIADKLSPLETILSTATHFVLKKYKDHGVVLEKGKLRDERMVMSL